MTKFRVDRSRLVDALATLAKAAPTGRSKRFRAVLKSARVSLDAGRLTLTATDLDVAAAVRLDALELDDYLTTAAAAEDRIVDLAQLTRIARETARTPTIKIELPAGGGLRVDALATLATEPAAEFPAADELDAFGNWRAVANWAGNAGELAAALSAVEFAADSENGRYTLTGLRLEFIGEPAAALPPELTRAGNPSTAAAELIAIATDGRRLAVARVAAGFEPAEIPGGKLSPALRDEPAAAAFTLPAKAAAAFLAALKKRKDRRAVAIVEIIEKPRAVAQAAAPERQDAATEPAAAQAAAPERRIRLTIAERSGDVAAVLVSRELDGRFPNWRAVAEPGESNPAAGFIVPNGSASSAIRSAVRLSHDENRAVRVIIRGGGRGFAIYRDRSSGVRFLGKFAAAAQAAAGSSRESRSFLIDGRFLLQWLEIAEPAANGWDISFSTAGESSPIFFHAGGGSLSYVLMPLHRDKKRRPAAQAAAPERQDAATEPAAA